MRPSAFLLVVAVIFAGCHGPAQSKLQQAGEVVSYFLTPSRLARGCFPIKYPDRLPSDFLEHFFIDLGVIAEPMTPKGVAFFQDKPDGRFGIQIVLRADDENKRIIGEGYAKPDGPIVYRETWEIPAVDPDPGMNDFCLVRKDPKPKLLPNQRKIVG